MSKEQFNARTARAFLEAQVQGLDLERPFAVNAAKLIGIVESLPESFSILFEQDDDNETLLWSAGGAQGRIAVTDTKKLKPMPRLPSDLFPLHTPGAFAQALDYGATCCHNSALSTIGLYGTVIVPDGKALRFLSSDEVMISAARVLPTDPKEKALSHGLKAPITLAAEECDLLATLVGENGAHRPRLSLTEEAVHFKCSDVHAAINLIEPLKHSLWGRAEPLMKGRRSVTLQKDAMMAFMKRANALAENKQKFTVTLAITDGQLVLGFDETLAQTEEYLQTEKGLKLPTIEPLRFKGPKFVKAFRYCDEILLDHIGDQIIVFRASHKEGAADTFHFFIAAQRERQKVAA